jgi:hypothetical protein
MLMMSSLHHHSAPGALQTVCLECLHHIHHSGHLTTEQAGIDNCVLCHFQSLPFIAAVVVELGLIVRKFYSPLILSESAYQSDYSGIPTTRAPPYIL